MSRLNPILPALLGALLTIGAGVFAFGQQLGDAQATARYWQSYVEGLAKLPEECRR